MIFKLRQFNNLDEGVYFDENKNTFLFDFKNDSDDDAISLKNISITRTYIKDNIFIFGYQLLDKGIKRNAFVGWLKAEIDKNGVSEDIQRFIDTVVVQFDKAEKLDSYNCIIYPDSIKNNLIKTFLHSLTSQLVGNGKAITSYNTIKKLFKNSKTKEIILNIDKSKSVLIVDDTYTSGSTINEIIRNIRKINQECNIVIFTLIKGADDNNFISNMQN